MTLTEAVQRLKNCEGDGSVLRRGRWDELTVSVVADEIDGEDIFVWNQVDGMKCALTPEDVLADDWEVLPGEEPSRRLRAV